MISKFDIQKLQGLSIEEVAERLGVHVKHHKALCPFHADSHPSLTFHRGKNRYRCFVCGASGGPIDLVVNTQGWKFHEACKWLANEFGIVLSDGEESVKRQVVKCQVRTENRLPEQKPDIAFLSHLMAQPVINEQAALFLFQERKIRPEVVKEMGLSSISYKCPMSSSPNPAYFDAPAILIPYRDIDGNLVSVQSRFLGESSREGTTPPIPRFRFPKGSNCHIFNMPALKTLKEKEPLFITEGVSDCLAMLSAGYAAIAIPSATLLKPDDIELLHSVLNTRHSSVHMYPDQDEPGQKLFFELKRLCPQLVYHQLPDGFKDVGQYYAFLHRDNK